MKTNIIASLLLGVAIACQAQSKNPAANQKPVAQLDGVGTPITDENSAMKSGATILKTEDGNAVMVDGSLKAGATFLKTADGKAFVVDPNDPSMSSGAQCFPPPPLDSSVAGVGVQLSALEAGVDEVGRTVEALGRAEDFALEAVGDHDVVADGQAEHGGASP